ncbi:MAG TPA: carboxypeptidase-like regulatory domain-containing protein [Chitinophagaceae bacterium]|jgi:hypothetical protein|nr:carboxypeptidase-like regulatory domain-containing protein [Chitinophagaceae bacterium]
MKPKVAFITIAAVLLFGIAHASDGDSGRVNGKKYDINGNVIHSENKKPIRNVNVTAYISSKKEKVVITDGNGNYAFDDLKPGTYKFVFEKEGFKKVVKEKVIIKTDESFQLNIEMIESNDFDLVPTPLHFADF